MIVQTLRTALFYVVFLGQTFVLAVLVGLIAIIWRRRTVVGWAIVCYWSRSTLFLLRWLVGIRSEITGLENLPPGPCIVAAKHQSDWDVLSLLPILSRPAFIAKKELMDIPFFGWAARSIDTISIDRKRGAEAIPLMLADARAALDRGCRIIIFPEGTRRAPLADPDYRQGIARLYQGLDVPVVPVALNSGLYWGRNSLRMWPGTARAHLLPPIPPGLDAKTLMARLVDVIETGTNAMILAAADEGLRRPLSSDLTLRLQALRTAPPAATPTAY